jgi:hypothetical protein
LEAGECPLQVVVELDEELADRSSGGRRAEVVQEASWWAARSWEHCWGCPQYAPRVGTAIGSVLCRGDPDFVGPDLRVEGSWEAALLGFFYPRGGLYGHTVQLGVRSWFGPGVPDFGPPYRGVEAVSEAVVAGAPQGRGPLYSHQVESWIGAGDPRLRPTAKTHG